MPPRGLGCGLRWEDGRDIQEQAEACRCHDNSGDETQPSPSFFPSDANAMSISPRHERLYHAPASRRTLLNRFATTLVTASRNVHAGWIVRRDVDGMARRAQRVMATDRARWSGYRKLQKREVATTWSTSFGSTHHFFHLTNFASPAVPTSYRPVPIVVNGSTDPTTQARSSSTELHARRDA